MLLQTPLSRFHIGGILERIGLLNLRWLSPELSTLEDMELLATKAIASGCEFLNMSFHSTSLLPACSPFVRDEQGLQDFIRKIECFLKFAVDKKFEFSGLSGALNE